jgi:hypothetical protein
VRALLLQKLYQCRSGWFVMKESKIQVQRAISAALRKLNRDSTFSADVRTLGAQASTDQSVQRGSSYLGQTIELILEKIEKEEEELKCNRRHS